MHDDIRYAVAPITRIEVRDTSATGDNTWTMEGYAAVFNQETTLLDSKFLKLTESIDAGAFDRVLREQPGQGPGGVVHFNFGHDMNRAVAATDVPANQPGSLELNADTHGLRFRAKVPRDDPDGVALASKMRSGVVKQASFAFTVADAEYKTLEAENGPDVEHRTILELSHLYDVCATAQGAYSSTVAGLRSYGSALGSIPVGFDMEGGRTIGTDDSVGGSEDQLLDQDDLLERFRRLEELQNDPRFGGMFQR